MACPFFLPTEQLEQQPWPHPARLPLGAAWKGYCTAGAQDDGLPAAAALPLPVVPSQQELQHGCNLGYARTCPRLPSNRKADAVRFGIMQEREGRVYVQFVFEIAYYPGEHGTLEYDAASKKWLRSHPYGRIQRMAECYLESYWNRRSSYAGELEKEN